LEHSEGYYRLLAAFADSDMPGIVEPALELWKLRIDRVQDAFRRCQRRIACSGSVENQNESSQILGDANELVHVGDVDRDQGRRSFLGPGRIAATLATSCLVPGRSENVTGSFPSPIRLSSLDVRTTNGIVLALIVPSFGMLICHSLSISAARTHRISQSPCPG
jgi:hypothetical protein